MNKIKEILKEQNKTQVWLAHELNKSYAVVTNYCNNKKQPSIIVLSKIALILKVDIRDLLVPTRNETMNNSNLVMVSGEFMMN